MDFHAHVASFLISCTQSRFISLSLRQQEASVLSMHTLLATSDDKCDLITHARAQASSLPQECDCLSACQNAVCTVSLPKQLLLCHLLFVHVHMLMQMLSMLCTEDGMSSIFHSPCNHKD